MATKGTEKHARVVLRLMKGGTKITKRLFKVRVSQLTPGGHIPSPWTIDEFLVSNKGKILANDAGRKKEKTYFPGVLDKTNLKHWDLSMFCYVLLETCELDAATRMDVRELRKLRNKLSHLSEPSLDDEKYTRHMEKLEVIFDRMLKKIGDTGLDIKIKGILNSSKDDELSLCNTYKEIYKFFQMEGGFREVLSEHTKDHKAILDKLDIIVEQTKNTDGAAVELPETDVYILVKNCNTEKEKLLSEWLKRLIDEKINKHTTLADEMSNESFHKLREAVGQAVTIFFSNGRLITSTENKCVLLRVRCVSLKHLVNLFRDCISGKLTEQMKPLEAVVKEIQDFENLALEVAIYTDEFWKVIEKTVSAVDGYVSSSQSKRFRVTIERMQLGSRMSHAVKLSIPAISYQHLDTLRESFECGRVTESMNNIQKAACMDLNLTNVSIEAKLLENSSTTGANDFSRGLEYGGVINIQCDTSNRKKWKPRYGIISKGFLYIYKNRNAKKTEHSYPLRQFESAAEFDLEGGENFCFCLRYKNPQAPILFSCDASDSREKWIEKLYSAISEVKPVSCEIEADSRFGSAVPLLRNKSRKQRYGIISKGFFYLYTDRKATKTEHSYPLGQFESAEICDPEDGENICFCLKYKNPQAPILFSCDTVDNREKWIEKLYSAILEVQSVSYNVSADSGIGSAEAVPRNKSKGSYSMDEYSYDQVDEGQVRDPIATSPVQPRDDDSGYMSPKQLSGSNNFSKGDVYENDVGIKTDTARIVQHVGNKGEFIDELKLKVGSKHNATRTISTKDKLNARSLTKGESPSMVTSLNTQSSLDGKASMSSVACSAPPFMSVRGGGSCVAIEESLSHVSVRGQDSLYENNDDTDNSTDSDNTSPKTIYENPEKLESVKSRKFKRKEYMCRGKAKAKKNLKEKNICVVGKQKPKSRELKQKPVGVYAVFSGESAELGLGVVTPLGLKYFRIHSQDERVSLFESHQNNTQFCSLDDLLAFYHDNILPRKDYSVKLERGYNTY